jgi:maleylacetoacetate isomerase/maleylpyruvate isomerase
LKLYTFFRSSAAYRVRIALNLKGVAAEMVPVGLLEDQHFTPEYRAVHPGSRVPALALDDGTIITQSLAIIDYLEAVYPDPPVYPRDPAMRAKAMAAALTIAADIHPVASMRVVNYIRRDIGGDQAALDRYSAHWIAEGLATVEALVEGGRFCFGDRPTVADLCLAPQMYNARRARVDLSAMPKIVAIDAHLMTLPAFRDAAPEAQADAR